MSVLTTISHNHRSYQRDFSTITVFVLYNFEEEKKRLEWSNERSKLMQLILLNSKRSISFSVDNVCSKKDIFVFNEVKKKNEHKVNDYIKRKNNRKTVKTDFIVKEKEG